MDNNKTDNNEPEGSGALTTFEIIGHRLNPVTMKTSIRKYAGNNSMAPFGRSNGFSLKTSPFDTFTQVIQRNAESIIDNIFNNPAPGRGTITPVLIPKYIKSSDRFKMIQTLIKSCDE